MLVLGVLLVVLGTGLGLYVSRQKAPADARKKIAEAKEKMTTASEALASVSSPGMEAAAAQNTAQTSTQEATSALDQVEGILSALPEHLRFAGLLVLVGTLLISVAVVQFGGVSVF